jgi:hypothetical protein
MGSDQKSPASKRPIDTEEEHRPAKKPRQSQSEEQETGESNQNLGRSDRKDRQDRNKPFNRAKRGGFKVSNVARKRNEYVF